MIGAGAPDAPGCAAWPASAQAMGRPPAQRTANQQTRDRKLTGAARPTIFIGESSLEQMGTRVLREAADRPESTANRRTRAFDRCRDAQMWQLASPRFSR